MTRSRLLVLTSVVLGCVALVVVYVLQVRHAAAVRAVVGRSVSGLSIAAVLGAPHLVFRDTTPGADCGKLAAVELADPGGARALGTMSCERVSATTSAGSA